MNQPMTRRLYYTFQELLDLVNIEDVQMPRHPNDIAMSSNWFTKLIEAGDLEFSVYTLSQYFTDELINDIVNAIMSIVYNRHAYDYIACVENPESDQDAFESAMYKALIDLINVLNNTIPRYVPMLQQNEYASTDPVTPVKSVTTGRTRFNDTPQEEGEFNDEPHATNVSKSTSEIEVDSGSLISRLDEMFKGFRSIILDWSNEFNKCFLKEEQL